MNPQPQTDLQAIAAKLEKLPPEVISYIAGMVDMAERLDELEQPA